MPRPSACRRAEQRRQAASSRATTDASASWLDGRSVTAEQVVVATGPFQAPYVPKLADKLADDVFQTHAVGYRRPRRGAAGNRPRRRWRQHRFSDRQGAVGDAQGRALGRIAPEAPPAASARARPLLVADEDANPRQDGRLASRPQAEHARHADRLEPARARATLRGRAASRARSTPKVTRFASKTAARSRSTP